MWITVQIVPESIHRLFYIKAGSLLYNFPIPLEIMPHIQAEENGHLKGDHPFILYGTDDPACCLHYFIHSRILVGIIEASLSSFIKIFL